jgi:Spy/CpxP family protein refolding chaperone
MLGFFTDYLDLNDAQQAQIKQIIAKEKPALEPLFRQEMQSRRQMMELVQSGSFDEAKAQALAAQGAQIHAQLEVQHARVASEAYQVLTADQKTKLAQFMGSGEKGCEGHVQQCERGANADEAPNR